MRALNFLRCIVRPKCLNPFDYNESGRTLSILEGIRSHAAGGSMQPQCRRLRRTIRPVSSGGPILACAILPDMQAPAKQFKTFADFYPYYLQEHSNRVCRRLHVIGSACVLLTLGFAVFSQRWVLLWLLPLIGYGFAWVGHFFFEKNRPATFTHPWYSLLGDWVMFWQTLTGRLRF